MLSTLREGGYIEVNRGVLMKINNLPDEF
ncbi:helix-turn-helix domain-containing protein [Pluralibacter sp.]|nr:helix-turn-helix domain-containing protein [Pluralibacter sp.]